MVLLEYDDWKKRLPFDNVLYKDIKRYSLRLNSIERDIMKEEVDFYRSRFSLEQIMTSFTLLKNDVDREKFIRQILKRADKILYMPECLVQHYKSRIKKDFKEFEGFFNLMLDKACGQSTKNPLPNLYKLLLGKYYKPVMSRVKKYAKIGAGRTLSKKLKSNTYDVCTREYMSKLKIDIVLGTVFGRCTQAGRLPLSVVDDYGNGEWVSKYVSYATDRFFLYTNKKSLTDDQMEYQTLYNVYPGKGHFYSRVLGSNPNICFDNGASILIDGWADYSACHSKGTAYSYSRLGEKSTIAKYILSSNLKRGYKDAWVYIMGRYPKDRAISIMIECSQYLGSYISSCIGHFGIECILNTDFAIGPNDFLDTMSGVDCGDYLAVYHPKIQKKLAETSITARVSKRFD